MTGDDPLAGGASVYLPAGGPTITVTPANGSDWSLEELQKAVGGYIEIVKTRDARWILVVDEEGALKGLPFNVTASDFAGRPIVGDALYCRAALVR